MEEAKQVINPNDLLIVKNIDSEPIEWQYDAIKTPLPYYIGAGETRELPYYIAYHGVNKLIDRILQKQNKLHTNRVLRAQVMEQVVLGLRHINYIREKSANEVALEEMQRKKETDPLQELLKKRQIEAERQAKLVADAHQPAAPLLEMVGAPIIQPIAQTVSNNANPIVTTPQTSDQIESAVAAFDPARQNVYNLLTTKLHMDLTHQKTKEKLDALSVDQLKTEFAAELPELIDSSRMDVADMPPVPMPQPPAPLPPPAPTISMNPTAVAAPFLDQQLGVA